MFSFLCAFLGQWQFNWLFRFPFDAKRNLVDECAVFSFSDSFYLAVLGLMVLDINEEMRIFILIGLTAYLYVC